MTKTSQLSTLLPKILNNVNREEYLHVLHLGPALPETVAFFNYFRCKLHFIDFFDNLPLYSLNTISNQRHYYIISDALQALAKTKIDLCFVWDLFDYIDQETLDILLQNLHRLSNKNMKIHGFAVHNRHAQPFDLNYAIETSNSFSLRRRERRLGGFSPHSPIGLIDRTPWLTPERSVLFNDGRIEFLLSVNQTSVANGAS